MCHLFINHRCARYSEAVDSRTGRMKAHQVAGGSGGVKPPEKGKGPAERGNGEMADVVGS